MRSASATAAAAVYRRPAKGCRYGGCRDASATGPAVFSVCRRSDRNRAGYPLPPCPIRRSRGNAPCARADAPYTASTASATAATATRDHCCDRPASATAAAERRQFRAKG